MYWCYIMYYVCIGDQVSRRGVMSGGYIDVSKRPSRVWLQSEQIVYKQQLSALDARVNDVAMHIQTVDTHIHQLHTNTTTAHVQHQQAKYVLVVVTNCNCIVLIVYCI